MNDSDVVIKKRYRDLVLRHHPDVSGAAPSVSITSITEAYTILKATTSLERLLLNREQHSSSSSDVDLAPDFKMGRPQSRRQPRPFWETYQPRSRRDPSHLGEEELFEDMTFGYRGPQHPPSFAFSHRIIHRPSMVEEQEWRDMQSMENPLDARIQREGGPGGVNFAPWVLLLSVCVLFGTAGGTLQHIAFKSWI